MELILGLYLKICGASSLDLWVIWKPSLIAFNQPPSCHNPTIHPLTILHSLPKSQIAHISPIPTPIFEIRGLFSSHLMRLQPCDICEAMPDVDCSDFVVAVQNYSPFPSLCCAIHYNHIPSCLPSWRTLIGFLARMSEQQVSGSDSLVFVFSTSGNIRHNIASFHSHLTPSLYVSPFNKWLTVSEALTFDLRVCWDFIFYFAVFSFYFPHFLVLLLHLIFQSGPWIDLGGGECKGSAYIFSSLFVSVFL